MPSNSRKSHHVLLPVLAILVMSGCKPDTEWRDRTLHVQVGRERLALEPANRYYSLGGISDEQVDRAIANGEGGKDLPIPVQNIRVGVFDKEASDLVFAVTLSDPQGSSAVEDTPVLPGKFADIRSLQLTQRFDRPSASPVFSTSGQLSVSFSNGASVDLPTECRGSVRKDNFRPTFCVIRPFIKNGKMFAIRSIQGRSVDEIESNFDDAFNFIADLNWE